MALLKIALLQMNAEQTLDETLEKGLSACGKAREKGADIALFPEVWSNGYTFFDPDERGAKERWQAAALKEDSAFVARHRQVAEELGMAIGLTYLEAHDVGLRNVLCLIDRRGRIVLRYAKVHTASFTMERYCAPGNAFSVTTLETDKGAVEVGAMICFDREFPESARVLALRGAELVLVPNACIIERHRIEQMKTRAFENKIALALTNYPEGHAEANGSSLVVSPAAFEPDENGLQGKYREILLLQTGREEGVYCGDIDLDELRRYRRNAVWGANFRRPKLYADLIDEANVPTFTPDSIIH